MPEEVFGALEDAFFAAGDAATDSVADVDLFLDLDPSPPEPGLAQRVTEARARLASALRAAALFCLWRARLVQFRVAVAISMRADSRLRGALVQAIRPLAAVHRVRWLPRASRVILLLVLANYSAALIAAAAGVI